MLCLHLALGGVCLLPLYAQKVAKIRYKANVLSSRIRGEERYQLLTGEVHVSHKDLDIRCDSALFFQKRQYLKSFGHVVVQTEQGLLHGNTLYYDGENRYTRLRGRVRYVTPQGELLTDSLDYNLATGHSFFWGGGKIVGDAQTLFSERGDYNVDQNFVRLVDNVQLFHTDYTLYCDTLSIMLSTGNAHLQKVTQVWFSEHIQVHAYQGGMIFPQREEFIFYHALLETPDYRIWGDTLFFDRKTDTYTAKGRVMLAMGDSLLIFGDKGRYVSKKEQMWMYGDAVIRSILSNDTLYIRSDTLRMEEDTSGQQLYAYPHVQLYGEIISARCDSVSYLPQDSLLTLRVAPIFWQNQAQITADSVDIFLPNNHLSRVDMTGNTFVISRDSLQFFNQIRGRSMQVYFAHDSIHAIHVLGNAESIFHALGKDSVLLGMNRIFAGRINFFFKHAQLDEALFEQSPTGTFFPPSGITFINNRLQGFSWQPERRPDRDELLDYLQSYFTADRPDSIISKVRPQLKDIAVSMKSIAPAASVE